MNNYLRKCERMVNIKGTSGTKLLVLGPNCDVIYRGASLASTRSLLCIQTVISIFS